MEPVSPALGGGFFTTDPRKAEAPILWSPDVKSPRILTLILGKTEGKRRREWQRMRWLESITDSVDMNLSKLQEVVEDRGAWRAAVSGFAKSWAWLSNRTTATSVDLPCYQRASSGLRLDILGYWERLARITNNCFVFSILIFQLPSMYYANYFIFTVVIEMNPFKFKQWVGLNAVFIK